MSTLTKFGPVLCAVAVIATIPIAGGPARAAPGAVTDRTRRAAQGAISVRWRTVRRARPGDWTMLLVLPEFRGRSPLAREANRQIRAWAARERGDFLASTRTSFRTPSRPRLAYEYEAKGVVGLASPTLLSLYFVVYEFTGGAHGNTTFAGMTFGLKNGRPERLTLKDLFRPGVDPAQALTPLVIPRLKAGGASEVVSGHITNLDRNLVAQWVVTPAGITLLIPPYAVGYYAQGSFFVKVGFPELQGRLDPRGPLKALLTQAGGQQSRP